MTLATTEQCSERTARALTDQLRQSLAVSWELLVEAYQRRAWAALGYESWDAYTDAELGEVRLRLPREQRREVVASMTDAGMSSRAIGSALGISHIQAQRDARPGTNVPSAADEPIDAELVDEPDPLAARIAAELAASDEDYAEQAAEPNEALALAAERAREVLGTDGKTYSVQQKPAAPRRKQLRDMGLSPDATWAIDRPIPLRVTADAWPEEAR